MGIAQFWRWRRPREACLHRWCTQKPGRITNLASSKIFPNAALTLERNVSRAAAFYLSAPRRSCRQQLPCTKCFIFSADQMSENSRIFKEKMAEETQEDKQNVQKCRIQLLFKGSPWFSYSTTTVAVWPWSLKKIRVCVAYAKSRSYPGCRVAVANENSATGATPQPSVGGLTPLYFSASFISSASIQSPHLLLP